MRGSRFQNGVSRIHGGVSSRDAARRSGRRSRRDENPIDYVTNGVHVPTFLAPEWHDIFDRFLGVDWAQRLTDARVLEARRAHPGHDVLERAPVPEVADAAPGAPARARRSTCATAAARRTSTACSSYADPDNPNVLTIGFARRFATYKRATLLFERPRLAAADRLRSASGRCCSSSPARRIPADEPGQDLIRRIMRGREDAGVRRQASCWSRATTCGSRGGWSPASTSGSTIPIYPLEASGTSGMKAAINGAINLSVLDGWWDEGYDGGNGWAIKPASDRVDQATRDRDEARTLYEILQDHVIPLYYERDGLGYSPDWVRDGQALDGDDPAALQLARACSASTCPSSTCRRRGAGAQLQRRTTARPARDVAALEGARARGVAGVALRRVGRAGAAHRASASGCASRSRSTLNGLSHRRTSSSSWCSRQRARRRDQPCAAAPPRARRLAHRRRGALRARARAGHLRQARLPDPRLPAATRGSRTASRWG